MLLRLTFEEIKKSHQSKTLYYIALLMILANILPATFLYFEELSESIIFYTYEVSTTNMQFMYPIIFIFAYSWSVGHEHSLKTYEILMNSKLNFEYFILSKFIAWTSILGVAYFSINLIYLIFLINTTELSNIHMSQLHITSAEFFERWLVVMLMSFAFLVSIGSLSMLITHIVKRWFYTLLILMAFIIFLPSLTFLDSIREYSPLNSFNTPQFFYMFTIDINLVLKTLLINIIYTLIFLIIFMFITSRNIKNRFRE